MCFILVFGLAALPLDAGPTTGSGGSPVAAEPDGDRRTPFVGTPTLDYNSDRGVGVGAVGTYYQFDSELSPYKRAIFLKAYVSSRLVQDHEIRYDVLRLLGWPLRLNARGGFMATLTYSYCGVGNATECDEQRALEQVTASGSADADAVRHYYHMRFLRPYAEMFLRAMLREKPHRWELFAGWRGSWVLPGDFSNRAPYAVSLFTEQFPKGQRGPVSQVLAGATLDDRDREAAPRRGYYLEGGMRLAAPALGSRWTWFGLFGSGAAFVPLGERYGSWVLATRLFADATWGDVPIIELGRTTGLVESPRFGGHSIGRGVRQARFLGKLNVVGQVELRAEVGHFEIWDQEIDAGGALFVDSGWIAYEAGDLRGAADLILWSTGLALRFLVNDNYMVRIDSGVSPAEGYFPRLYVKVGNPF